MEHTGAMSIFAKVAELSSISGAARALSLPKATVSRAVSRLEAEYQISLIARSARRVQLTEIGEAFYHRCLRILEEIGEAEAELAAFRGHPSGTLRIGCPSDVGRGLLAPRLHEFLERYPDINLRIRVGERLVPEPNKLDVVLHSGWLSDSRFVARKLSTVRTLLVASRDYVSRRGFPEDVADLADHDVIGNYYHDRGAAEAGGLPAHVPILELAREGERFQVPIWPRFATTDHSLMLQLVKKGVAIAPIAAVQITAELGSGELVRVLPNYTLHNPPTVFALYTDRGAMAPKVTAFLDFLVEVNSALSEDIRRVSQP